MFLIFFSFLLLKTCFEYLGFYLLFFVVRVVLFIFCMTPFFGVWCYFLFAFEILQAVDIFINFSDKQFKSFIDIGGMFKIEEAFFQF